MERTRIQLLMRTAITAAFALTLALACKPASQEQPGTTVPSVDADLIQPADLAAMLKAGREKPVVLHVGFRVLYVQGHIPGSEYIGSGGEAQGIAKLQKRVGTLPKDQLIVLYCGCCPWQNCPNMIPAYEELKKMGFTKVRMLYIRNNFGADWVDKGYPSVAGE
ncbi:MAG: rhodanese-like domain-containing protein [Spirochaetia bacterium]|nr:rhodanese-like domain-containing protein [Spirochaetia bacterium]